MGRSYATLTTQQQQHSVPSKISLSATMVSWCFFHSRPPLPNLFTLYKELDLHSNLSFLTGKHTGVWAEKTHIEIVSGNRTPTMTSEISISPALYECDRHIILDG